jgi:hypothetical protein
LIACKSFMEALLSGFQRVVCRLALPSNRWLNGLRQRFASVPSI